MRLVLPPVRHRRHGVLASLVAILAIGQASCQRYERRPLDLEAHRGVFLSRLTPTTSPTPTPSDPSANAPSSPGAFDASDGLSLAEGEVVALVYNADLRVARLAAGVTRATVEESGRWDDPTIGVDVARILQGGPSPWKVLTTIGLTLPISGRLRLEKERAGLEHEAEVARVAHAEWRTRMSLRRAWVRWSSLETVAAVDLGLIEQLDRVLPAVDALERGNEITRAEARLFRIERAQAAASLAQTQAQRLQAELEIRRLMGLAPTSTAAIRPEWPAPSDPDAPTETLTDRSPALLVARAEYEVSEKSLELEMREQYPDLTVAPGYGREDGKDEALLNLMAPLPILNANRRGIAEATARRETARARAEGELESVMSMLAAARERTRAARERRRLLEQDAIPLADAQLEDARRMAELGEVNVMVLLESLRRQNETRRRAIEARTDESLAAVDAIELTGDTPAAEAPNDTHARRTP